MDELAEFWVHETAVRTHKGSGPFGEEYEPPVAVPCFVDARRQLVRDTGGREVTSETTITGPVHEGHRFTPGSLTTVNGDERAVITLALRTGGGLDLPEHFEATTT
ncbi:hypothetical protein ACTXMZ_16495 [Brachybacterium alimentarium]|uniref:hypothetical protein n=1 Tax=Brachybacterium alimentarium TaxID=47845 RepID=UPI003FD552F4